MTISPDLGHAAVKTAWKLLVRDLGGVDAVAACTRASRSLASEYGNVQGERFAPVDVVLDAEAIAGVPHVTATMARLGGYELIPTLADREGSLAAELQLVASSSATLFADAAVALTHPNPTDAERERLRVDLERLIRVARVAQAALGGAPASHPKAAKAGKRNAA